MFVIACNPCPCGDYRPNNRDNQCSCAEVKRREYRKRISGPISDRIDITRHIEPVRPDEALDPLARPEPTEQVRRRVTAARAVQANRYAGTAWRLNGDVPGPSLRQHWPLSEAADRQLLERVYSGRLTRRGATRVHRLAWTVADLAGAGAPGLCELETALRLRSGEPLEVAKLPMARTP